MFRIGAGRPDRLLARRRRPETQRGGIWAKPRVRVFERLYTVSRGGPAQKTGNSGHTE